MRKSTNLWRGCMPIWTTKINPSCQCFGVLYVKSTRLRYVGSKTLPGHGLVAPCSNHKMSNVIDHVKSEQHKSTMMFFVGIRPRVSTNQLLATVPSLKVTNGSSCEGTCQFNISMILAKVYIPFLKYPAIHESEERHKANLGTTYKNKDFARNFVHYIAESQRQQFHISLASCHFYSVLMDGSTDKC